MEVNKEMLCWIIPLVVGLLSMLIGYLIGRRKSGTYADEAKKLEEEKAALDAKVAAYEEKDMKRAEILYDLYMLESDGKEPLVVSELRQENSVLKHALEVNGVELLDDKSQDDVVDKAEEKSTDEPVETTEKESILDSKEAESVAAVMDSITSEDKDVKSE